MTEPKTLNLKLLMLAISENNKKIIEYVTNSGELELLRKQNALLMEEINQLSEILDTINRTVVT